jgi:hypothetical protein
MQIRRSCLVLPLLPRTTPRPTGGSAQFFRTTMGVDMVVGVAATGTCRMSFDPPKRPSIIAPDEGDGLSGTSGTPCYGRQEPGASPAPR